MKVQCYLDFIDDKKTHFRYDGFLRAAIADPAPDRRWFRRGWVTFRRDVKIKDICFNLNNIRLKDCELGPIVNRDLMRR